jgi:glycosyltransferase involved in cell wall biosynthesis
MSGVSVIATVKNEAATIGPWVRSVLAQSRPPDEIVIVDGGSDDGTVEAIRAVSDGGGAQIVVDVAEGANISAGRNRAIATAAHPIIAVTDAGTTLEPDWLERLVAPLEDAAADVASGFFFPGGETFFERALSAIITPHRAEVEPETFLPSSRSVAFRKDAWQAVGGYPEWLEHCEDLVFDMDLKQSGQRFAFVPDAQVSWSARPTLRRYYRQYWFYARGDGHADLWRKRHAVRYGSYAAGAALAAASLRRPVARAALAAGMAGHFGTFARRLWRHRPFGDLPRMAAATALVPVVVVTGDVAKMLGYPVGVRERRAAGGGAGLASRL